MIIRKFSAFLKILQNKFIQKSVLLSPLILLLFLSGCSSSNDHYAPVTDGWQDTVNATQNYKVQPDETLYSIAWRFGLDYRELAANNNLTPPYHLRAGQIISVSPENNHENAVSSSSTFVEVESDNSPVNAVNITQSHGAFVSNSANNPPNQALVENPPIMTQPSKAVHPIPVAAVVPAPIEADSPQGPVHAWVWPAHGRIINHFSDNSEFNKGIDIAGKMGQPVLASAAGKVVYCGSGLHGYGQLIIIKHNDEYLSAYAHNSKLLVHEGQVVKSGQQIALMGDTEAQQVMLHFEIRCAGKPVDPLDYLGRS